MCAVTPYTRGPSLFAMSNDDSSMMQRSQRINRRKRSSTFWLCGNGSLYQVTYRFDERVRKGHRFVLARTEIPGWSFGRGCRGWRGERRLCQDRD